jgi:hypothetical protein
MKASLNKPKYKTEEYQRCVYVMLSDTYHIVSSTPNTYNHFCDT